MIRCIIRSNGYPSHFRVFQFDAQGREAIVNPKAKKDVDAPGEPLVLTQATYDYLWKENGRALRFDPVSAEEESKASMQLEAELLAAQEEIASLNKSRSELSAIIDQAMNDGVASKARIAELEATVKAGSDSLSAALDELAAAKTRIADLEAAATAKKSSK